MAEEEDKKGEDKGDHINLKVKDQVRNFILLERPSRHIQGSKTCATNLPHPLTER